MWNDTNVLKRKSIDTILSIKEASLLLDLKNSYILTVQPKRTYRLPKQGIKNINKKLSPNNKGKGKRYLKKSSNRIIALC